MSRKDYVQIALAFHRAIIAIEHVYRTGSSVPHDRTVAALCTEAFIDSMIRVLEVDNPRFDAHRFRRVISTGVITTADQPAIETMQRS